jgi:hypothetical protein
MQPEMGRPVVYLMGRWRIQFSWLDASRAHKRRRNSSRGGAFCASTALQSCNERRDRFHERCTYQSLMRRNDWFERQR